MEANVFLANNIISMNEINEPIADDMFQDFAYDGEEAKQAILIS